MKAIRILLLTSIGVAAYADTAVSLPTLTNQANSIQQAILQQQQSSSTALNNLQNQLNKLQAQIAQYNSPDFKMFTWAASDGSTTPENAFVAAMNGDTPLYICQAVYSDSNTYGNPVLDPGVLSDNGCVITYGGQAYLAPTYSVLVSTSTGGWVDGQKVMTQQRMIPQPLMLTKAVNAPTAQAGANAPATNPNQPTPLLNQLAVVGGQENGQDVYICRAKIGTQYFVGKVLNNTCFIAAGSKEASWPVYEVLLVKQPNM